MTVAKPKQPHEIEPFIGEAEMAIDTAGRTNLPTAFRKNLGAGAGVKVYVTIDRGRTLALYSVGAWKQYLADLREKRRNPGVTKAEFAKFYTRVTALAKLSELDGQNRITLTDEQKTHAGIADKVTFVGGDDKVRLWAPDKYAREIKSLTPEEEALHEELFG